MKAIQQMVSSRLLEIIVALRPAECLSQATSLPPDKYNAHIRPRVSPLFVRYVEAGAGRSNFLSLTCLGGLRKSWKSR